MADERPFARALRRDNYGKTKIEKKSINEEVKMIMVEFHLQSTQAAVDKQYGMNSRNGRWITRMKPLLLAYLFMIYYGRTHVDVHITTINRFQPEGCPWKFLLQLLSLDVSR